MTWKAALYSAACAAVDASAGPPLRDLPERMPDGLPAEVYVAELMRRLREAGGREAFRAPLRVTGEALVDQPDAPAVATAILDPSEVWLVAGRLHFIAADREREVEAAFKRAGAAWESVPRTIGRVRAAAAGVLVWRG